MLGEKKETGSRRKNGRGKSPPGVADFCSSGSFFSTPLSKFSLRPAVCGEMWLDTPSVSFTGLVFFPFFFPGKKERVTVGALSCSLSLTGRVRLFACVRKQGRKRGIESANLAVAEWEGLSGARWYERIERPVHNVALADYSGSWWFVGAEIQMWIPVRQRR